MEWPNLGNPAPRAVIQPYSPVSWPEGDISALPSSRGALAKAILSYPELTANRRTRRSFKALERHVLGALLEMTCRVRQLGSDELGFRLSRTSVPSAGAIHPVHVLIVEPGMDAWFRYDGISHSLVRILSRVAPQGVYRQMQTLVNTEEATLIVLAAEPGMTAAKYENPASLVWRDAGFLLAYMSMAAEALGASFCPLGVTGEPWVGQLIDQPGLAGVGVAFVGATPV